MSPDGRAPVSRRRLLLAAVAAGLVWGAPPASAATFTPTRFDDPAPGACTAASCSLREAVIAANASPGDDTIVLAAGTYTLSIAGANENGSLSGDLDVLDSGEVAGSLEIVGASGAQSVIDAGNIDRVLEAFSRVTLRLLELRRGTADLGGILRNHSQMILRAVGVEHGTATVAGGGAYNTDAFTASSTEWIKNEAKKPGGRGGTFFNAVGASATMSTAEMQDSLAADAGGAIFNAGSMTIATGELLDASTLSNGGAGGGGIFNSGSFTLGVGLILRTRSASNGGGVMNTGRMTLAEVTIRQDRADDLGGGVANTGTININGSTITGNTANRGGGFATVSTLGTSELFKSTVSTNEAKTLGGGVYADGPLRLAATTVALNSARNGGGVFAVPRPAGPLVEAIDTIVAYSNRDDCGGKGITSSGHNLSSDLTCPFTGPGDQRNTNPWLAPLGDYGGRTHTHALLWGSPAIDRGVCPTQPSGFPERDQRRVPQPQDGNGDGSAVCDIGSFELQPGEFITAKCTTRENGKALDEHQKSERKELERRQKAEEKAVPPRQRANVRLRHALERKELETHQKLERDACSPGPAPGPPSEPPS